MSADERVQRVRELLLTRIERYGYTMTQVIGSESRPSYTYTLGLPRHIGHPELAVCGIDTKTSIDVITSVVALLEESPALDGRVVGALQGDMPLWIAPLPAEAVMAHLGAAGWWRREHHDGMPASAKQIVVCKPGRPVPLGAGGARLSTEACSPCCCRKSPCVSLPSRFLTGSEVDDAIPRNRAG